MYFSKYIALVIILLLINSDYTLGQIFRRSVFPTYIDRYNQKRVIELIKNIKKEINTKEEHITYLTNVITTNYCKEGQYYNLDINFKKNNITCSNCPINYYRTKNNNTCTKCPPGYYSNEGAMHCIKSKTNDTNVHTLCEVGTIVPDNKFADECYKCNKCNKEYMPHKNNNDKCLICPPGSIVTKNSNCIQCSEGTYENNNQCFYCEKGTYADRKGMDKCKICENNKSFSYFIDGGVNCDDSIIYTINDNINSAIANISSYMNLDMNLETVFNPLSNMLQSGTTMVITNRKPIIAYITGTSILGVFFLGFFY